jgi:hypothetical protein
MKILHGHVGTEVRVHVDDANAIPQKPPREDGEAYDSYGDSTFSIDPDGTLYIYGDRSKPAHHSYGRHAWLWVGDELAYGAFNTAHGTLESPTEGHG